MFPLISISLTFVLLDLAPSPLHSPLRSPSAVPVLSFPIKLIFPRSGTEGIHQREHSKLDLALEGRFQLNLCLDFAIVEEVESKFRSLIFPGLRAMHKGTQEFMSFMK